MGSWTTEATCHGTPEAVLGVLTEPGAIARWSPLPFEVRDFDRARLRAGDRIRVGGEIGGRGLEFLVQVTEADDGRLSLTAVGPIEFDVEYLVRPVVGGSRVQASVDVAGRGLGGRILARAVDAMLAAGALRTALDRIAREAGAT